MSVFKVNLSGEGPTNRTSQGSLDTAVTAGVSVQRSVWVPGPNRINRQLFDGATFTDVNYWKRYAYPQAPYSSAFLTTVTDDGSVWVDGNTWENVFPRNYTVVAAGGSVYSANVVNVLSDNNGPAIFTQITVATAGTAPTFRFNGVSTGLLSIGNNTTQVFDKGDLAISKIEIDNSQSGNATATVTIFMSIQQTPNS